MSTPAPFSGVEFDLTLGEVYGLRTWRADEKGRLRALHLDSIAAWRPGVNVATCHTKTYDPYGGLYPPSFMRSLGISAPAQAEPKKADGKPEPHLSPVESCRCGFYAYTDPQHEELLKTTEMPQALGIIRGTGRTLVGTKGFRCEKAEIVALLDPARGGLVVDPARRRRRAKLRSLYPEVPLLRSRKALYEAFPVDAARPSPADDAFWTAS